METLKQRGPKLKRLLDSLMLMISYLRFLMDMKLKWETKGRSYRAGRNSVSPLVGHVHAVFFNYMYVAQTSTHLVLPIFDFCLLARVLVGNPKLLILDEATSALDNKSELVVQDALDNILQQKKITTIIVAHRLSTIRNSDIINILVGGVIVESGTHAALMDKQCYYRKLVEKQDGIKDVSESNSALSSRCGSEVNLQQLQNGWSKLLVKETASIPHIAFNKVTFAYPTRPKKIIFDGINLNIERGSTVALVGPSGGGKSTTVGLVERFYDPVSGTVEYGGTDVKTINVHWYRDQIGYVGQEPVLCKCTPSVAAVSYRIDGETHVRCSRVQFVIRSGTTLLTARLEQRERKSKRLQNKQMRTTLLWSLLITMTHQLANVALNCLADRSKGIVVVCCTARRATDEYGLLIFLSSATSTLQGCNCTCAGEKAKNLNFR